MSNITIAGVLFGDRNTPPSMVADQARDLDESGAVDCLLLPDQLGNFFPPELWTPENAPMAAFVPDPDSLDDPFVMAGFAKASAPNLGLAIATDAVRHGPATLSRAMLSLANLTAGDVVIHLGSGEIKNLDPYGWRRREGLKRLEDQLRAFRHFWESDGPFDFDGHHWSMRGATLGATRPHRPQIWAMGNGPKLIDLAAGFADGLTGASPLAWTSPERCAERIAEVKAVVASKDRDPEAFGFGIVAPVLLHDDESVIDQALDNVLVRWLTAVMGRIDPTAWSEVGLPSPVPDGWTYHMDLTPTSLPPGQADEILAATTREHAEHGFLWGSPDEVARQLSEYAAAGVTWIAPVNYLGMVSPPEEALMAGGRTIELCRALRARV